MIKPHPSSQTLLAALAVALICGASPLHAGAIVVPNGSFESPTTFFVTTNMSPWVKTPVPLGYSYSEWENAAGIFANTSPGTPDHISNADERQVAYMFANPGLGIYQTLNTQYEVGLSYDLTVALASGFTYPLEDGTVMRIALYYANSPGGLEAIDPLKLVAFQDVVYVAEQFPGFDLKDFTVHLGGVTAEDAWAGKSIGILIMAMTESPPFGGTWGIDNVRLTSTPVPELSVASALACLLTGWCGFVRRRAQR